MATLRICGVEIIEPTGRQSREVRRFLQYPSSAYQPLHLNEQSGAFSSKLAPLWSCDFDPCKEGLVQRAVTQHSKISRAQRFKQLILHRHVKLPGVQKISMFFALWIDPVTRPSS